MQLNLAFIFCAYCVFVISKACNSDSSGYWPENGWNCTRKENSRFNATYDCNLNKNQAGELWLWLWKLPDDVDVLVIQNCKELTFYTGFPREYVKDKIHTENILNDLRFFNISNLSVNNTIPKHWNDRNEGFEVDIYDDDVGTYSYYTGNDIDFNARKCLLKHVAFENVKNAVFHHFFDDCVTKDNIKSVKLINFHIEKPNLKLKLEELIMNQVSVNLVGHDAFHINSTGAIRITDSNFSKINNNLIFGIANEVIISNNIFGKLYGKILTLQAEKIIFISDINILRISYFVEIIFR